ncbi:MAG: FecR family protein [Stenotrophomonas sp.]
MKDDDMLDPMHDDQDDDLDPIQAQAAAWFARLRADDANSDDRQQADAWLAAAPEHRAAYQRLQQLWAMLGDFAASAEVDARMPMVAAAAAPAAVPPPQHSGRTATSPRSRPRGQRVRWWVASAAALATVAIGWKLLGPTLPSPQQYATEPGQQRSITLDDGTVVDLDAASRMQVSYNRQERRIALEQGRAFFRVAKDPQRPLSVDTDSGSVRAVGTQFEVYRHDGTVSVALFEGKVQLRQPGNDAQVVGELTPGQRAQLRKTTMTVETFAVADAPAWTHGQLVFENMTLAEAVAEFNRYGGTPIRVTDPELRQLKVSGVFRSNDAPGFLDALHTAYQVSSNNDGKEIQLRR